MANIRVWERIELVFFANFTLVFGPVVGSKSKCRTTNSIAQAMGKVREEQEVHESKLPHTASMAAQGKTKKPSIKRGSKSRPF